MAKKTREIKRSYLAYTQIGEEWFTLRAARASESAGATVLKDVLNLDADGTVLDRWAEVRLKQVPLLLART